MNANRIAIKTKKVRKDNIKVERSTIKDYIKKTVEFGLTDFATGIEHNENLEWLKRKGFEVTQIPNTKHTYKISWEHKL